MRDSILEFGDTGDGKTVQFGELARSGFLTHGQKSRLYTWDEGGYRSIMPLVRKGIIDVVDCRGLSAPFDYLDKASQGLILDREQKWVKDPLVGDLYAIGFEGLTEGGDLLMREMSDMSAKGINIGGAGAFNFTNGTLKVGSNNQSHYGQAQSHLSAVVKRSFRIPYNDAEGGYIVWTAAARRGADGDTGSTVLGPQIVGKALTSEVPRWFVYTFHLLSIPEDPLLKRKGEHRLYFRDHFDPATPGAKVLGNDRVPLGVDPLPAYISPADLPKALAMIEAKMREADLALDAQMTAVLAPEAGN